MKLIERIMYNDPITGFHISGNASKHSEKLLGKKHFAELLAGLVERPQGKPVLVTEDDKRPEINTAQNDFNE